MFRKVDWFFLAPDTGEGEGGEPSKDDDTDDDTDFLNIDKEKKESISDDDEEGILAARSKDTKKKSKKSEDKPSDDRPENIAEKFWDVEKKEIRVDALAKSHKEAESALSRLRAESKVPELAEEYLEVFIFDE